MKIRITASGVALAAVCAAGLVSAPLLTAPTAHAACAANQIPDPVTGVCWSAAKRGGGISGTGGTCMPGRLGLCLGALQNSQMAGANLPVDTKAGPSRQPGSWP
jgi:hypothetical protein